jgi:hypothetical protein
VAQAQALLGACPGGGFDARRYTVDVIPDEQTAMRYVTAAHPERTAKLHR